MPIRYSSVVGGSGSNGFNLDVGASGNTTFYFNSPQPAGGYSITSQLADSSIEFYAIAEDGTLAGYTNTKALSATKDFDTLVVYGATTNDLITFEYKSTTLPTASGDQDSGAAPFITSVSDADLANIDDTTIITGGNFATDVTVTFTGTDSVVRNPKSVVRTNSTQLIVTRPDDFLEDNAPYTIEVSNPGISQSAIAQNTSSVTAGGDPTWITASGLLENLLFDTSGMQASIQLQALDPDGSEIIYEVVSGQLPSGLSLNANTGEISGTIDSNAISETFVISATDEGGNVTNRSFSIGVVNISSVISSGLVTWVSAENLSAGQTYASVTPMGGSMTGDYIARSTGTISSNTLGNISVVSWANGKAFDQRGGFGLVSSSTQNIGGQSASTIIQVGEVNNAAGNSNGSGYHIGVNFGEPNGTNKTRAIASNGTHARSVWYSNDIVYSSVPSSVGVKDYQILRNQQDSTNFIWENSLASYSGSIATVNGVPYSTGAPSKVWSHWRDGPGSYPYGYIAEFLIFDRYLSNEEVSAMKSYFAIKYGI